MPGFYADGEYDIAGFIVGVVERASVIDGRTIVPGDVLLALPSAGLHTNGYSLARRVVKEAGLPLDAALPGTDTPLVEALLAPHRWYGPALMPLLARGEARALAHVTGGGIAGNLARMMPDGARALLIPDAWERPPLVRWLVAAGGVPEDDARASLNLGIGMVVVCARERAAAVTAALVESGERVYEIGTVEAGARGVEWRE